MVPTPQVAGRQSRCRQMPVLRPRPPSSSRVITTISLTSTSSTSIVVSTRHGQVAQAPARTALLRQHMQQTAAVMLVAESTAAGMHPIRDTSNILLGVNITRQHTPQAPNMALQLGMRRGMRTQGPTTRWLPAPMSVP